MNSNLLLLCFGVFCVVACSPDAETDYDVEVVKKVEYKTEIIEEGENQGYGRHHPRGSHSKSNERHHGFGGAGAGAGGGGGGGKDDGKCYNQLGALHELYYGPQDDHYYTPFVEDVYHYGSKAGGGPNVWQTINGSPGFVAASGTDCKCNDNVYKAVHLLYRSNGQGGIPAGKADHFYLIDPTEIETYVLNQGYGRYGAYFYCSEKQGHCGATLPLKRYYKGFDHIYTTSEADGNTILAQGGKYEGVLCYIWPSPVSAKLFLERNKDHPLKDYVATIGKVFTKP